PDTTAPMLQQQIEAVRKEGRDGQDGLRREVGAMAVAVKDELNVLQRQVAAELKGVTGEVTRQLQEGMALIQGAQAMMGQRLDATARVVGDVQGSLGKLSEATQRVVEIGRDIQGLEQVLPREHWTILHGFRSGEKVDAVIRIGDRLVPVDANFPLENFRRVLEE